MAQLKETKIYGGLDVYDSYENKVPWLKLAKNDAEDVELNVFTTNTNILNLLRVDGALEVVNGNNSMMAVKSSNISLQNYNILSMSGASTTINVKSGGQFTINDSYNDKEICHYNSSEIVFNSFDKIKNGNNKTLYTYINETVKDKGVYVGATDSVITNLYLIGTTERSSEYSPLTKVSTVYITGSGQINAKSFKGESFYATSDERLKENIKLSNLNFIDILNKFKIKEYNFKDDVNKQKNVGIIAQDLLRIIPEDLQKFYLTQDSKGFYSVNDSKLVYLLIGALQQEHNTILKLEDEINELKKIIKG